MDSDSRQAAAQALLTLSRSDHWRDRLDAACGLAAFVDQPAVRTALPHLLVDGDTAIITEAAIVLLHRREAAGLAALGVAGLLADDQHVTWLESALRAVLVFESDHHAVTSIYRHLADDPGQDDQVHEGARVLLDLLADVDPPM